MKCGTLRRMLANSPWVTPISRLLYPIRGGTKCQRVHNGDTTGIHVADGRSAHRLFSNARQASRINVRSRNTWRLAPKCCCKAGIAFLDGPAHRVMRVNPYRQHIGYRQIGDAGATCPQPRVPRSLYTSCLSMQEPPRLYQPCRVRS